MEEKNEQTPKIRRRAVRTVGPSSAAKVPAPEETIPGAKTSAPEERRPLPQKPEETDAVFAFSMAADTADSIPDTAPDHPQEPAETQTSASGENADSAFSFSADLFDAISEDARNPEGTGDPAPDAPADTSLSPDIFDRLKADADQQRQEAIEASVRKQDKPENTPAPAAPKQKKRLPALYAAAVCMLCAAGLFCTGLIQKADTGKAVRMSVGETPIGWISAEAEAKNALSALTEADPALEPLLADAVSFTKGRVSGDTPRMTQPEIREALLDHVYETYTKGFSLSVGDRKDAAFASDPSVILTALHTADAMREDTLSPSIPENGITERTSSVTWTEDWVPKDRISDEGALVAQFSDPASPACLSYDVVCLDTEALVLAYDTDYREQDEAFDGVSTLISEGRDGLMLVTTERRFDPDTGEERSAEESTREVLRAPVNAVAYYGQYPLRDESLCTGSFAWPLPLLPDKEAPEGVDPASLNPFSLKQTYLSSPYGERDLWGKYDFHLGYDIVAPYGTEITACDGGVVVFAAYTSSYGYVVRIQHADGVETVYAHQKKLLVKAGDTVEKGQCIGYIGATGVTSGPHLHLEFRKDHVTCDPALYISIPEELYILGD